MGVLLQIAKPRNRARVLSSIVGKRYGLLTVLKERRIKNGLGKSKFDVLGLCVCGVKKWVSERSVRRGLVKSCGRCANKTHGMSKTPEYAVWRSMLGRCYLLTHKAYLNYGGRGIRVCKRWHQFKNFYADMGKQPFKGASIERVDNMRGYSKTNCTWATAKAQNRNRRSNRFLTINGMTKTLIEWSEYSGIGHNTISYRLKQGWPLETAISVKPNFSNRI